MCQKDTLNGHAELQQQFLEDIDRSLYDNRQSLEETQQPPEKTGETSSNIVVSPASPVHSGMNHPSSSMPNELPDSTRVETEGDVISNNHIDSSSTPVVAAANGDTGDGIDTLAVTAERSSLPDTSFSDILPGSDSRSSPEVSAGSVDNVRTDDAGVESGDVTSPIVTSDIDPLSASSDLLGGSDATDTIASSSNLDKGLSEQEETGEDRLNGNVGGDSSSRGSPPGIRINENIKLLAVTNHVLDGRADLNKGLDLAGQQLMASAIDDSLPTNDAAGMVLLNSDNH
ncbi:hypothetical protein BSL78_19052 [Apostichopus japonicus]|uniref:Uncharacterized protein n=1 Tax=Stichopus japonicus TaxID=307972 RepID=A0A2G8K7Y9_STIJA|nr:hypothetical protein BSL78_19052 [Apostichopus japonicus]